MKETGPMKIKNPILVVMLASIAIIPLISQAGLNKPETTGSTNANTITMVQYTDAALKKATMAKKPVAIFFTAEWCYYCQKLKAETFPDKAVQAKAEQMVFMIADMTDDKSTSPEEAKAASRYGLQGFPTTVLISKSGKHLMNDTIVGYAPAKEYAAALEKAIKAK